jgi:hypothetical protein
MDGFISCEGSVTVLTRCLLFEFKTLALLVLEILSVCCANHEQNASFVLNGLRLLAQHERESPLSSISLAILHEDVEVKHSVLLFINTLSMACSERDRFKLSGYLGAECFDENIQHSLSVVEKEMALLHIDGTNSSQQTAASRDSVESKLRRRSLVSLYGRRAYDKQQVEKIIETNRIATISLKATGSFAGQQIEIKSNSGLSLFVNPLEGSMAGLLYAAKNADKMEAKLLDFVGGKKTKRRWCELDDTGFKWCAGHDKEADYKGHVPIASIRDVRPYTVDTFVSAETQHCFEFDTPDRVYAMGCETVEEKDHWVTALQRARDNHIMSQASYRAQHRELKVQDVSRFVTLFQKQVAVYVSIAEEDSRVKIITGGVDLSKLHDVSNYLVHEAVATGSSGALLMLLQELLVTPVGLQTAVCSAGALCVRALHQRAKGALPMLDSETAVSAVLSTPTLSLAEQLRSKIEQGGAQYAQLNKLALQLMQAEAQVTALSAQLRDKQVRLSSDWHATSNIIHSHSQPSGQTTTSKLSTSRRQLAALVAMKSAGKSTFANDQGGKSIKSAESELVSGSDNVVDVGSPPVPAVIATTVIPPHAKMRSNVASSPPPSLPPVVEPAAAIPKGLADSLLAAKSGDEGKSSTAAVAQPVVDARFEKFAKMKRMLPEGAVRQKMMLEGFSDAEIDGFFDGTVGSSSDVPPAAPPSFAPKPIGPGTTDDRFAKFEKMRKMLPEGAVRQKMMIEGFTSDEIENFFCGGTGSDSTQSAITPIPAVDDRFAKYDKMRKMLPEGAVRQKMQVDGISASDIEAFFTGTVVSPAPVVINQSAPVVDERFARFEKMKKILPEGAVRQKMQVEGFSAVEIDAFLNGTSAQISSPLMPLTAPAPVLDERFARFEKMKKILPEGAVRQKMQAEGFKAAEIDVFLNGSSGGNSEASKSSPALASVATMAIKKQKDEESLAPPPGMSLKSNTIKPKSKVKALFWQKLKNQDVIGTLWHHLDEPVLSEEEYALIEDCFAAKQSVSTASASANGASSGISNSSGGSAKAGSEEKKLVSLLDGKRTQNVLILLGKLRRTPEDIMQLCVQLNPQQLDQELTRTLIDVLPTTEEYTAVSTYSDPNVLDAASKFLFHCRRLAKLQVRLECHEICFTWTQAAQQTQHQLDVVKKACAEFQESEANLRLLLALVLSVGNFLNGDSARGQAYGVRLDIFAKLSTLKANNPSQGTLLHVIAQLAEKRPMYHDVLAVSNHWLAIFAASEISWKQLLGDIAQLNQQVVRVQNEFKQIKNGCENAGLDGVKEDINGATVQPLHHRLNGFLSLANPQLSLIQDTAKDIEALVEGIFNRFGESMKRTSSESETGDDSMKKFWSTFADFGRALSAAVEENKAKKLATEKAQKLADDEAARAMLKQQNSNGTNVVLANAAPASIAVKKDNLFGNFHSAQATATANDLVAEFKNKLAKQLQQPRN